MLAASVVDEERLLAWHEAQAVGLGIVVGDQRQGAVGIQAIHALEAELAFGASMVSGLQANFGTMTKPLHSEVAARSAVTAITLAAAGFTTSPTAITGANGLFATYGSNKGSMRPAVRSASSVSVSACNAALRAPKKAIG